VVLSRGVVWSDQELYDPEYGVDSGTDSLGFATPFTVTITGLPSLTQIRYRAYARNAAGVGYGTTGTLTTKGKGTVTTNAATTIQSASAIMGGTVNTTGGYGTVTVGVYYATTLAALPPTGTTATKRVINSSFNIGESGANFALRISGLSPNTTYRFVAYVETPAGEDYGSPLSFTTTAAQIPTVTIGTLGAVTSNTANISSSNVTGDGGSTITERGVCFKIGGTPTISDFKVVDPSPGTGLFSSTLTGLLQGENYVVRAYATNVNGTGYSATERTFTTQNVPTVTTNPFDFFDFSTIPGGGPLVNTISATVSGTIDDTGGASITKTGVVWSTSAGPLVTSTPGGGNTFSTTVLNQVSFKLPNLATNQTYYYKAYAENSIGIGYGNEIQIIKTIYVPTINANTVASQNAGSVVLQSNITSTQYGNIDLFNRSYEAGFYYSFTPIGGTQPGLTKVVADGAYRLSDTQLASPSNRFTTTLTINEAGSLFVRTYVFNGIQEFLAGDTSVVMRDEPTLTTGGLTQVEFDSVTTGGNVTSDGNSTITQRGVCYATTTNPDINDTIVISSGTTGPFTVVITGLNPLTTYFFRAFATNAVNTAYGNEVSTTTPANTLGIELDVNEQFDAANFNHFDTSGNGRNSTIIASPPVYKKNTTIKHIDLTANTAFTILQNSIQTNWTGFAGSGPFSVSLWIWWDVTSYTLAGPVSLLSWGLAQPGTPTYFNIQIDSSTGNIGKVGVQVDTNNSTLLGLTTQIPLQRWTNIHVTYGSGQLKTYINSVNTATVNVSANIASSQVLRIGGGANRFNGRFGLLRMRSSLMSAQEIVDEYTSDSARFSQAEVALWWDATISQASGGSIVDISGHSPTTNSPGSLITTERRTGALINVTAGLVAGAQALNFASNGVITSPNYLGPHIKNDWSVSVWFRQTTSGTNQGLFIFGDLTGGALDFHIHLLNSQIVGYSNNQAVANLTGPFVTNTWQNVIFTHKNNTVKLYINGSFIVSVPLTFTYKPSALLALSGAGFGTWNSPQTTGFLGAVNQLKVWTGELTYNQVANEHATYRTRFENDAIVILTKDFYTQGQSTWDNLQTGYPDAVFYSETSVAKVPGFVNNAIVFDGNTWMGFPTNFGFLSYNFNSGYQHLTLIFIINPDAIQTFANGTGPVICHNGWNPATFDGFVFAQNTTTTNRYRFTTFHGVGATTKFAEVNLTANTWQHVVVTVTPSDRIRIYVNGVEASSSISLANANLHVGTAYTVGGYDNGTDIIGSFKGSMRVHTIRPRVMTADEILSQYNTAVNGGLLS
jgi:hypothetical protein